MDSETQATIAILVSLSTGLLLPLIKFGVNKFVAWRKLGREGELADRKQNVDENVTFAKEWRELYKQMEEKVARMEQTLQAIQDDNTVLRTERGVIERQKKTLEERVSDLEAKFAQLTKAFEFLALKVEQTNKEHVEQARRIAKGDDTWLNS